MSNCENVEKLDLVLYPDPVLKKKAEDVEVFDETLSALAAKMSEIMAMYEGIGIAAPQVGVLKRLFIVINYAVEPSEEIVMVNPKIELGEEQVDSEEGCLSLPGIKGKVKRATTVSVTYQDLSGTAQTLDSRELTAICIQHELDHLNGILFIDHLNPVARKLLASKLKRIGKP